MGEKQSRLPAVERDLPDMPPEPLGFLLPEAWRNMRSDHTIKRLWRLGLLEDTFAEYLSRRGGRGNEGAQLRRLAKWLKGHGFTCSERALRDVLPYAVQSHHWSAEQFTRDLGIDPTTPDGLKHLVRKAALNALVTTTDADTITKLSGVIHQRHAEKDKDRGREQGDERLAMQAREYERRMEAQQMEGAEFIDAVLAEADRLEHLRALRRDSLASNEPVKERLRKIRAAVWGKQMGDNEEGGVRG